MNYVYDLMTLDEVSDYLRISRQSLDRMRKTDKTFPEIVVHKGNIRVKFEHLQSWIDKKTQEQIAERKNTNE